MGQKTHPLGFRLGIIKKWESNWYAEGSYADNLHSDLKLRAFIKKELYHAGVSSVQLERKGKQVKVNIFAARPGIIIGKKGQEVDKLKSQVQKMLAGSEVFLNIKEERKPEINAQLVAENIALQLERRVAFRRAMKKAVSTAMRFGAKGIRVNASGRLAGAEIARMEWYREGRVPLHTIRADIDFGFAEAKTTYGIIGVKVWLFRGEVYFGKDARRLEEQRKLRSQRQIEEAVEAAKAEMGIGEAVAEDEAAAGEDFEE
ncbi:MAG: 30S ribosomal protein S3 [Nitrospinae bacterium]|nr:30S ribosomal protein S3 [Nitrospinota bacterium]